MPVQSLHEYVRNVFCASESVTREQYKFFYRMQNVPYAVVEH